MEITRRAAIIPSFVLPAVVTGQLVQVLTPRILFAQEEPQIKPPRVYTFNKKTLKLELLRGCTLREYLPQLAKYLKVKCILSERDSTLNFLNGNLNEYNKLVSPSNFSRLSPKVVVDDEKEIPEIAGNRSPEEIWYSMALITIGYPLVLESTKDGEDIDLESIQVKEYRFKGIVKNGIYYKATILNQSGEREQTHNIIPINIPVFIKKEGKAYYIDIDNPVQVRPIRSFAKA